MAEQEGVIKYTQQWEEAPLPEPTAAALAPLLPVRDALRAQHWLGTDAEGIDYGNVSIRYGQGFLISGSQTSHTEQATAQDFCNVTRWDNEANTLWCQGPKPASSEALSHAAFYDARPEVGCVLHIHHQAFWEQALHRYPTTPQAAAYGTPAMARAVQRLVQEPAIYEEQIMVMAGHEGGIFAWGSGPTQAYAALATALLLGAGPGQSE